LNLKKYESSERGDLLIFLSGMSDIQTVYDAAKEYALETKRWIILQLHSSLSIDEQEKVNFGFHLTRKPEMSVW
jgi:HrpA-like RNA helicase